MHCASSENNSLMCKCVYLRREMMKDDETKEKELSSSGAETWGKKAQGGTKGRKNERMEE